MCISEFLETYPAFSKLEMKLPEHLGLIEMPLIHMHCGHCGSARTFVMKTKLGGKWEQLSSFVGAIVKVTYICTACRSFQRLFVLKFNLTEQYVMKVAQDPEWEISSDGSLEKAFGRPLSMFHNGRLCEAQGKGLGAFAYYQRVLDGIIDNVLSKASGAQMDTDREQIQQVLQSGDRSTKVQLVEKFLPPAIMQNGAPLTVIYSILEEGLRNKSDEQCVELAEQVREVLVYVVTQIEQSKRASRRLTQLMQHVSAEGSVFEEEEGTVEAFDPVNKPPMTPREQPRSDQPRSEQARRRPMHTEEFQQPPLDPNALDMSTEAPAPPPMADLDNASPPPVPGNGNGGMQTMPGNGNGNGNAVTPGNGNGNGHATASGNGNGNGNGNGHAATPGNGNGNGTKKPSGEQDVVTFMDDNVLEEVDEAPKNPAN